MQNRARMVNRLPEYMNAYNKDTLTYDLLDCMGDALEDAENMIAAIMTTSMVITDRVRMCVP